MSTLTFVYADATAVLGPLSGTSEPHAYDLCDVHAQRLTPPRGWDLLRVPGAPEVRDDLVAISDVVHPPRRGAHGAEIPSPAASAANPAAAPRSRPLGGAADGTARPAARHLHVIRSSDD